MWLSLLTYEVGTATVLILETSKLRTLEQGGGSAHLCSSSEWMTTRCGTRSWAWGARPPSPHRPSGWLWLAAPHRHLVGGKIRQVSVCPGLYPVRARQAVQGKSRAEAGKAGAVCSEAAVVVASVSAWNISIPPATTSTSFPLSNQITDTYTCQEPVCLISPAGKYSKTYLTGPWPAWMVDLSWLPFLSFSQCLVLHLWWRVCVWELLSLGCPSEPPGRFKRCPNPTPDQLTKIKVFKCPSYLKDGSNAQLGLRITDLGSYAKCGLGISSIKLIWEHVINAESQVPPGLLESESLLQQDSPGVSVCVKAGQAPVDGEVRVWGYDQRQ